VAPGKKSEGRAHRGGGATGSARRGGVPVGGRLRRGGSILGAVLRLAAEAGKVATGAVSERTKSTAQGGGFSRRWAAAPFLKGPAGRTQRGGGPGRRAMRGTERE
jgi:hypothetical protein